ncbi:1-phosphofructokinase [Globicatella sanguinis]|uniref:1-phosphofructokinase n=1 Tax=Globicatella sanguinis TaxID=13076 RepID=UPI000825E410|nr:1-phosphofructokinase [Globicatella sanguinis]
MIYTLTLNPALDHIVRLEKVEAGETNRMDAESVSAGGKGINVSKILKNLGERSIALGYIAGFTGKEIERVLRDEDKILSDFILVKEGFTRINTKIKADVETEINGPGLTINEADRQELINKLEDVKNGDYLFLSGSIPASLGNGFYAEIMELLKDKEVAIAVDTTGEALKLSLPYGPTLVKPNLRELEDFFGVTIEDPQQIEHYSKELQKMGAKNIIVSMGGDGAYFLSSQGDSLFLAAPKGEVIDTVGSGDSMVAGFMYGLKNQYSPIEAFKLGVSCGSATAFSENLGTKDEIMAIYNKL